MQIEYDNACQQVLALLEYPLDTIVSAAVIDLLPVLAAVDSESFAAAYLEPAMTYLSGALGDSELRKRGALVSVGIALTRQC